MPKTLITQIKEDAQKHGLLKAHANDLVKHDRVILRRGYAGASAFICVYELGTHFAWTQKALTDHPIAEEISSERIKSCQKWKENLYRHFEREGKLDSVRCYEVTYTGHQGQWPLGTFKVVPIETILNH